LWGPSVDVQFGLKMEIYQPQEVTCSSCQKVVGPAFLKKLQLINSTSNHCFLLISCDGGQLFSLNLSNLESSSPQLLFDLSAQLLHVSPYTIGGDTFLVVVTNSGSLVRLGVDSDPQTQQLVNSMFRRMENVLYRCDRNRK
jgi:hypothetical protein